MHHLSWVLQYILVQFLGWRVGQGGGAGSASKVYVGNLPSDVTKEVPETEVLTFCVCAFPKLLFARGTPTCLQHLWAKSLTLWHPLTYSRPLTFMIFTFQHKSKILGAGFCSWGLWKISISWQEGGRFIADLFIVYSIDSLSILSFRLISSCERSKSGQASAFVKYFGAGEVRNSEMDWKLLNLLKLLKLLEVIQVIQVSNVSKLGGFGCDKCYETRAAWHRNLGPWQRGRIGFIIFQHLQRKTLLWASRHLTFVTLILWPWLETVFGFLHLHFRKPTKHTLA